MSKNQDLICKCGKKIEITVPMYADKADNFVCKECYDKVPYKLKLDFSKCKTRELQGNYKDSTDKFLEIREGNNSIVLRFSKDQWFFLAGMFIDALSEEEKQGIAEMSFDGIILT